MSDPTKKPRRKRGTQGRDAELLLAKWLRAEGWLVHLAARAGFNRLPNGASICSSHDLFGAFDALAMRACPGRERVTRFWFLQVTTQNGRVARRRKIEALADHLPTMQEFQYSLVSHERTPDPANLRRSWHHWRIEDYLHDEGWTGEGWEWTSPRAVAFDPEAL